MPAYEAPEKRFWRRVRKEKNGCWLWLGRVRENGYATFDEAHGKTVYAHRWSYERLYGPIPAGGRLQHTCCMFHCVNPQHLRLVTAKETVSHAPKPSNPVSRFWKSVQKTDWCWLWVGTRTPQGYGRLSIKNVGVPAHRFSWELHFGEIRDNLFVCHRCDNPSCVRPDHLFLGTNADNINDAVAKGRIPTGDKSWSHLHPERLARGERSGAYTHPEKVRKGREINTVKLTVEEVLEIVRLHDEEGVTKIEISRRFPVSRRAVQFILNGRNWAWLWSANNRTVAQPRRSPYPPLKRVALT